jgi:glutamate racemase
VIDRACPLFVPLVEEGWFDREATRLVAEEYLAPIRAAGVDVLVLGCTHYPMLKPLLRRVMGNGVQLIDSADETAAQLARVLAESGLAAAPDNLPEQRWVATDDALRFAQVGAVFMGGSPAPVEIVELAGDVGSGKGREFHA